MTGFLKIAAISLAISSYRLVAAVDPDTAGVENHPNTPQQTLLGVSVTFTILTILTLESVQIFSRHSGPETAKV